MREWRGELHFDEVVSDPTPSGGMDGGADAGMDVGQDAGAPLPTRGAFDVGCACGSAGDVGFGLLALLWMSLRKMSKWP